MEFKGDSLDDLMYDIVKYIKKNGSWTKPSQGHNLEIIAPRVELTNPLARVSHSESRSTLFSCLGELIWYISGRDDLAFLQHYIPKGYNKSSDDGISLRGAYGPRIFGSSKDLQLPSLAGQFAQVASILREKPDSRQAVIQILRPDDISEKTKDVPCTCTLQFLLRDGKLHLVVYMRSNDAFIGFPHDVFNFTMFQEIMARTVSAELGSYKHIAGSMHLYKKNMRLSNKYINEGLQETRAMPPMPNGDPWPSIRWLVDTEENIRNDVNTSLTHPSVNQYWSDLARILKAQILYRGNDLQGLKNIREKMSSKAYGAFMRAREYSIEIKEGT